MKIKTLFKSSLASLAIIVSSQTMTLAQCPPGDVILNTQEDLNNFIIDYPDCEDLAGVVTINGVGITDLSPMANIKTIAGQFQIVSTSVTSLTGLENLNYVGSSVNIASNSLLMDLNGLNNLDSTAGYFQIISNPLLVDISALSNLKVVHSAIAVINCSSLTNLDGLENLESVDGAIMIYENAMLTDISGIRNIDPTSVKDYGITFGLTIEDNPLLSVCNYSNICDAKALVGITPGFTIVSISGNAGDCADAASFDMACLMPLSAREINLTAVNNGSTVKLEWSMIAEPTQTVYLVQRSNDGQVWSTISHIPSNLSMPNSNYSYIDYNPNQGENYYRIQVRDVEGKEIFSNVKYVELNSNENVIVFPNPAHDIVTIQTASAQSFTIKNILGQTIYEGISNNTIDISNWSKGIYMIQMENGENMKLIKD